MDTKCCKMVYGEDGYSSFNPSQCSKKPFVERDGKTYCRIHDPEYVKAKEAKRQAEIDATKCQKCGHIFYGYEKRVYAYCPMCGTKRSSHG